MAKIDQNIVMISVLEVIDGGPKIMAGKFKKMSNIYFIKAEKTLIRPKKTNPVHIAIKVSG